MANVLPSQTTWLGRGCGSRVGVLLRLAYGRAALARDKECVHIIDGRGHYPAEEAYEEASRRERAVVLGDLA